MTVAVVLAAGLGRRLAQVTALPKWLTPVGATCPAEAQLAAFEAVAIARTHVVVGPGADAIEGLLAPWHERLAIEVVHNDRSSDRNNWYSLLLGLEACGDGTGPGGDVVVVNSDLFASPGWFAALIESMTSLGAGAGLAIDPARGRTDEAMKVAVGDDGAVRAIGKVGVPAPDGEYVGLAWLDRAAARGLAGALRAFLDQPERSDHWYEHAIQEHLTAGARYRAVPVPSSEWVEIDDEDDLAQALALGA